MRRIALHTGRRALFGGLLVLALLATLPMRLVIGWLSLDQVGFSARAVGGSIWQAALREARIGGVAVGDFDVGLSPLDLLIGRARIMLSGSDRSARGAVTIGRHLAAYDGVSLSLPPGTVFGPAPIASLDLDDLGGRFESGRCTAASGRVRTTLVGEVGGIALGQQMSGTARCDGGALLVPLVSASGSDHLIVRLSGDGSFQGALTIAPEATRDAAAVAKLALAGFQPAPGGYRLAVEGRF